MGGLVVHNGGEHIPDSSTSSSLLDDCVSVFEGQKPEFVDSHVS